MIKIQILTATTPEALEDNMSHWTRDGWHLHEGIVITAWKDIKGLDDQGRTMIEATACGFLQVLTRTEGRCKIPQAPSESD